MKYVISDNSSSVVVSGNQVPARRDYPGCKKILQLRSHVEHLHEGLYEWSRSGCPGINQEDKAKVRDIYINVSRAAEREDYQAMLSLMTRLKHLLDIDVTLSDYFSGVAETAEVKS